MNLKHKITRMLLASLPAISAIFLGGCSNEDKIGEGFPYAGFTMSATSAPVEEEILFTNTTSGGSGSYSFAWEFGDGATSRETNPVHAYMDKGVYEVKLTVNDANGRTTGYSKVVTIVDRVLERGSVEMLWVSSTNTDQIRSVSPALSPDGSRVYITSEDHKLHCYDAATGAEQWALNMRDAAYGDATTGNSLCTPAVDVDGTVFVGTGTSHGKLFAVNPDGTVKWCAFEDPVNGFWNNGKAPAVYIGQTTPIIAGNYVYIGNRGSAGSMVAFDKYTGIRANFVTQAGNPAAGPAGGFQADCVLDSRSGMLYLYCNTYGIGGVKMADFTYDNTATFMSWATVHKGNTKCAGASAIDADGNLIALVQANVTTTVVCIDQDGTILWETPVTTAGLTDQGGIAIASDGTIYASMKTSGNFPGGVVALTSEGAVKWHYETSDNVSSAPVVDRSGNIVFVTEQGNLYIIAPDGQETLVSVDMGATLAASESAFAADWSATKAKMWSSPVMSDDGVIYFGITNNSDTKKSVMVAVKAGGITGPDSEGWPMRGRTANHSCTR